MRAYGKQSVTVNGREIPEYYVSANGKVISRLTNKRVDNGESKFEKSTGAKDE